MSSSRLIISVSSFYIVIIGAFIFYLYSLPAIEDEIQRASKMHEDKDYRQAIEIYDNVIEQYPWHFPALFNKGLALMRLGQFELAYQFFNEAMQLEPDDPRVIVQIANVLSKLGRFQEAIDMISRIGKDDPYYLMARHNLGCFKEKLGAYDEALTILREVVRADTTYTTGFISLGRVLNKAARPEEALASYSKAKLIDSSNHHIAYAMAKIHAQLGNHEQVFELLSDAAKYSSDIATRIRADADFSHLSEDDLVLITSNP
ncbi:MAG: tetratricopeptide repeat protein [Gemmatimonadetes bacterium]|nr:tetratricopeptide repeat protein [Gemmatimonadota bacterium]